MITRFSVSDLYNSSKHLSKVASNKIEPELILSNARIKWGIGRIIQFIKIKT